VRGVEIGFDKRLQRLHDPRGSATADELARRRTEVLDEVAAWQERETET